jgi:sec-independent protein translocase protein TatA
MPVPGVPELIVILVIVIVIFGAGRLSELGGAMGKTIKEFRKATQEDAAPLPAGTAHPVEAAAPVAAAPVAAAPVGATATSPAAATAPVAVAVENKCPSCATVNPSTQAFCGQCGTRLTRAA